MTYHWTLIFIAATANVCLNLSLMQLGRNFDPSSLGDALATVTLSPWMWLSALSGTVLLAAFVAAVRTYSLSMTYIGVTALAMVALTAIGMAFRYEAISPARIAGLAMIVAGLILSAKG